VKLKLHRIKNKRKINKEMIKNEYNMILNSKFLYLNRKSIIYYHDIIC